MQNFMIGEKEVDESTYNWALSWMNLIQAEEQEEKLKPIKEALEKVWYKNGLIKFTLQTK